MILNGISKIKNDGGDYLLVVDYGMEGLSVSSQHQTLEEAITASLSDYANNPRAILKLVRVPTSSQEVSPMR